MSLTERLRRVERQLRALGDLHVRDLGELAGRTGAEDGDEIARKLRILAQLQADELALVAQEVADMAGEAASEVAPAADPARSAKRERWLAEQERRAKQEPVSRRELLFGRSEEE